MCGHVGSLMHPARVLSGEWRSGKRSSTPRFVSGGGRGEEPPAYTHHPPPSPAVTYVSVCGPPLHPPCNPRRHHDHYPPAPMHSRASAAPPVRLRESPCLTDSRRPAVRSVPAPWPQDGTPNLAGGRVMGRSNNKTRGTRPV